MRPKGSILMFAVLLAGLPLHSCFFTGVESTPKITAGDVRRQQLQPEPEDTFLKPVVDAPLSGWNPGKQFVVTDSRIALVFGSTAVPSATVPGTVIEYAGASETPGVTGETVTDLMFVAPGSERMVYRVDRPLRMLMEAPQFNVPFTVQKSVVDEASALLDGRRMYVLTSSWRDGNGDLISGGRKFVAVTVDSVTHGTVSNPLKISFTDDSGRHANVYISPGAKGSAPRTFGQVFSLTDPRRRYPSVSDETWALIIDGRVSPGMTREECRLSLGAPKEVERGATQSYLREAWLYENGIYLLFEDGLLKQYRR